ncbi:hypothetical protein VTN96DRAFT_161 [Rasamsonia emersonii]|uniref:RING finger domain protein n=1 Tax=Rasamsonia emersonii (strain ATCC 16479 / CBS 393.64 / IMI 116815) TaxID=1408163 RepID=A0A0F4YSF9_RASE3|nr:RING finger domain protein [Rasamsonia emersonii CBS 393.64]KKA21045.1 RING finger domain protein [Rasamsonia emersonii CBS 393.64]
MASLPPRHSAGGRSRSSDQDSSASTSGWVASGANNDNVPSYDTLGDSETVLLNRPSIESDAPSPSQSQSAARENEEEDAERTERARTEESLMTQEPRKCWICYTDETEDSPLNSEWRSPCPCALTAHEACLLDWLADLENPRNRKRNGGPAKMQCPQCKSEIVISRPRSYIVDIVRAIERLAGRLVLPGMVFTLAGTVWAGCCAHGVYSMYFVFGTEDARRIFEDSADGSWNPGLNLGLPLIPLVLIFSRTRYAEGLLPAIPVLFFATHNPSGLEPQGGSLWPPSAAMTFAALPYVKSFYNALYERVFGPLERKWIAEVQPRHGEEEASDAERQGNGGGRRRAAALGEVGDGQILMEIDLELQLGVGDDQQDHDIPADAPDVPVEGNQQNGEGAARNNGQNRDQQILGRHREELIHDTSSLADTVLGALLFPAISASMGGLLKWILPKSWTTPPSTLERGKTGLLQSRWGRSVVGGCLFVLLKDAIMLYCRWKLAQTHRKRRVLNYDRAKKPVVR